MRYPFAGLAALLLVTIPIQVQPMGAQAMNPTISFESSSYQLGTPGLTWQQARAEAASLGGKLLEVDSAAENEFVLDQFWDNAPIWLGWNDVRNDNEFVGATENQIVFENWLPGEPNNSANGQNYVRIAGANGQWDDGVNTSQGIFDGSRWVSTGTTVTVIEFDQDIVFGNSRYELGVVGGNWDNAADLAAAAGGKLLTIESQEENDFIVDNFWNRQNPGRIMLGITDIEEEGIWKDQDGEIVYIQGQGQQQPGYTNWFGGRADNVSGSGGQAQQADWGSIQDVNGKWDTTWYFGGLYFDGSGYVPGRTVYVFEFDLRNDPSVVMQNGTVTTGQSSGTQWHNVSFDQPMQNPIVVMGPVTFNGVHEAFARVRNVTTTGFEFKISEWKFRDGAHVVETVSWMALERGTHDLGGDLVIEAGALDARTVLGTHQFTTPFRESPAVFGQVASHVGADPVVPRIDGVTTSGFRFLMQEEEASFLGPVSADIPANGSADYSNFNARFERLDDREFGNHTVEEFHYIALSEGSYDGFLVGRSEGVQRDTDQLIDLDLSAARFDIGGLLLQTTSMNAYNPAAGRLDSLAHASAQVFFQEETSYDPEVVRRFGDSYSWLALDEDAVLYDDGSFR